MGTRSGKRDKTHSESEKNEIKSKLGETAQGQGKVERLHKDATRTRKLDRREAARNSFPRAQNGRPSSRECPSEIDSFSGRGGEKPRQKRHDPKALQSGRDES